ncbi:MAG TPA: MFS transporter [Acetobacteraceae bacterium]|jgi:MFS family permease|nr:MFS transporter [Acetobacteraceae bacterium]
MSSTAFAGRSSVPASHILGRKLDSIPFSAYHVLIILVLGAVGFVEGYDLALGGSLLVLAKAPLKLTSEEIRWLAVAPTLLVVLGGFTASAMSDRISRKTVMQIGVVISTGLTLLIPLAQTGTQLLVIRLITGIGLGFAISAPFPIAAELMPKQHRRTYGAIFEVMLASAFTLLPFAGFLLAGNPNAFRLIALPGGLALGIVPLLVHFGLPESARWYLRRGNPEAAVETVNRMIAMAGNRVPKLTVADLGSNLADAVEALPPFAALFRPGQLGWTVVGILCYAAATTAYYCSAILLPKALVDQGSAVGLSFGLGTLLFMVTIPGKFFNGFIMEIIGRRWSITYCLGGSVPGLVLMAMAHNLGDYATVAMTAGAIITGFTVLSSFPAVRVYLSEQFPTALRGRGHFFGEATGRIFSGVLTPFFLEPYTGSATIFFGTIAVVVAIGACIPLLFGKETVGQLELVTEPSGEPVAEPAF